MPFFAQELFIQAEAKGPLTDAAYLKARADCVRLSRQEGIDALLAKHKLDAIVTLTSGPACLIDHIDGDTDTGGCTTPAAVAGYPHITVPAGFYQRPAHRPVVLLHCLERAHALQAGLCLGTTDERAPQTGFRRECRLGLSSRPGA